MKLKKAFRLALSYNNATEADFARDIGKSRVYVSAVARQAIPSTPGMTKIIADFAHRELMKLRNELNAGINIEAQYK